MLQDYTEQDSSEHALTESHHTCQVLKHDKQLVKCHIGCRQEGFHFEASAAISYSRYLHSIEASKHAIIPRKTQIIRRSRLAGSLVNIAERERERERDGEHTFLVPYCVQALIFDSTAFTVAFTFPAASDFCGLLAFCCM